MKLCNVNKSLVRVLVIGFTFYCVILLVSDLQPKRINQFVAYAQPKAAEEATITEAVNQTEEVRQQLAEIQGKIKVLQDQITEAQPLWYYGLAVGILAVTLATAILIYFQVRIARRTGQQEVFMSLVSELNKIKWYPEAQLNKLNGRDRMDLIVQLHNYLDGVRDVIIREGNVREEKIKKLRNEEDYQMRLLMWYKNLQICYIHLDPKIDELPYHCKTKLQKARSDPHIDPDSLICVEEIPPQWFHYFPRLGRKRNTRRKNQKNDET